MATNIAAVAYVSRKLTERKFAIAASLLYSLGRMLTYVVLGVLLINVGLKLPFVQNFLQDTGVKVLGPLLILAGILMLLADRISLGQSSRLAALGSRAAGWGLLGAFIMGVIFALAFCPYSAVLFFAVFIPSAAATASSSALPALLVSIGLSALFAIGTGLPVIIFGALLSSGVAGVAGWVNSLNKAEKVIRIIVALVFIGVGIYYLVEYVFH
jgi:cytochrome c-type biogenesis protein